GPKAIVGDVGILISGAGFAIKHRTFLNRWTSAHWVDGPELANSYSDLASRSPTGVGAFTN
ncbi:hypothetical protein, partial [Vibrio azureus]|uniref:hypothetical protein n=1 Tax=Vibrio azureus TaxID=512649 RepID=UPI000518D508